MDNQAQLKAMRELFLAAPESGVTSVLAVVISLTLVVSVLTLSFARDDSLRNSPRSGCSLPWVYW